MSSGNATPAPLPRALEFATLQSCEVPEAFGMAEGGAVAHRMARSAIVTRWNVVVRCACVRACVRRSFFCVLVCVEVACVHGSRVRACFCPSVLLSERASERAFVRSCVRAIVRSCVRAIAGERLSRGFAMAEGGTDRAREATAASWDVAVYAFVRACV